MGHVILPKFVICAGCYACSAKAASEVTTGKNRRVGRCPLMQKTWERMTAAMRSRKPIVARMSHRAGANAPPDDRLRDIRDYLTERKSFPHVAMARRRRA
jgi:hypothetical protein